MLRILAITLSTCLLLAGTAFSAELKIGVADMQVAGSQSEPSKNARAKYESDFNEEADQIDKQKKAFEQKVSTFVAQRPTMGQKTMEERANSLQKEEGQMREKEMRFQQKVGVIQNAIAQEIAQIALDAAAEIAKAKGFDYILAQNSVLYSTDTYDVTQDLINAINKIWKDRGSKTLGTEAAEQLKNSGKPAPAAKPAPKKK